MSASLTARGWQRDEAIPATRAGQATVARIVEASADDARARQKQVECRVRPAAQRARGYHRPAAAASASRITSRGAPMPNHHSNASAPCSSNMQKPSSAA